MLFSNIILDFQLMMLKSSSDWPLLLGDDQHVIEQKQVVAPVAESPPDAELFGADGQLSSLLQPTWRRHQRKRLRGHRSKVSKLDVFITAQGKSVQLLFFSTCIANTLPKHMIGSYLDFTKIHLFLDGVHLLCPLHPPRSIVAASD